MRPIHLVQLDKLRPALILTRAVMVPRLTWITVAPITGTIRGLSIEVPVGPANGLDKDSVINCDNVTSVQRDMLGRCIGYLLAPQERLLTAALHTAYELA